MSASSGGRRQRGAAGAAPENEERWLLTYSDMITLLMALFIVMWAISSVNISKFDQLKAALQSAFSAKVMPASTSILTGQSSPFDQNSAPIEPLNAASAPPNTSSVVTVNSISAQISARISASLASEASAQDQSNLAHIQHLVEQYARAHGFAQQVNATIEERGLVVRLLTDNVLFGSGQAALQEKAVPLLHEIAGLLAAPDIANAVVVEGNTDTQPIHSSLYRSNWELSSARADAVLEVLQADGVKPDRLAATGYGDVHPVASNATVAGRAANRRVDIVILRRSFG